MTRREVVSRSVAARAIVVSDEDRTEGWRNPAFSPRERATALLAEMTIEEKAAQLGSVCSPSMRTTSLRAPSASVGRDLHSRDLSRGIGQLTRAFGTDPVMVAEGVRRLREIQQAVTDAGRLEIPALVHEECLTGVAAYGATAFPSPLAWAATFDEDLVRELGTRIGTDLRARRGPGARARARCRAGLPLGSCRRDARRGPVSRLTARCGVRRRHRERRRRLDPQALRGLCKLPWGEQSCSDEHGATRARGRRAPAVRSGDPFGRRPLGHERLQRHRRCTRRHPPIFPHGTLRDEWGFAGTVVSDYWTIPFLADKHRVARDAALFALDAGIDVELPESVGYGAALAAAGREGRMPEAVLDRAVLRHLETKAMAGLLDAGRALVPDAAESTDLDSAEHRDLARRLASESTIMLRDGMPDLAGSARIAVIGPCADEIRSLMGCYAFPNHVLTHHPELDPGIPIRTVLDALGDEFPRSSVVHARGADVLAPADPDEIARAVEVAVSSDAVVLVVGDVSGLFGTGSSGEGCDVGDLRLPGGQHELVQEILALGIPTVLVVVSGRPYALGDYDAASAVVQSFTPGVEGRR